jgi:pilus assembly protein Flp/PilA
MPGFTGAYKFTGRISSNWLKSERPMCLKRFMDDESGATAIEYGLLTALISLVMISSFNALGDHLKSTFATVSTQLAAGSK